MKEEIEQSKKMLSMPVLFSTANIGLTTGKFGISTKQESWF